LKIYNLYKSKLTKEEYNYVVNPFKTQIKTDLISFFHKQGKINKKDYKKYMLSTDLNEPLPKLNNECD